MSINRAILLGHVGGDPEIRTAQSGDKIASFSLATSEQWRDKATGDRRESTEWHRVVCFNQPLVAIIEQYVKKGSKVSVQGQIKTRKWQANDGSDRYSTEIVIANSTARSASKARPRAPSATSTPMARRAPSRRAKPPTIHAWAWRAPRRPAAGSPMISMTTFHFDGESHGVGKA
jgi:single-strand DNA-binding protein